MSQKREFPKLGEVFKIKINLLDRKVFKKSYGFVRPSDIKQILVNLSEMFQAHF